MHGGELSVDVIVITTHGSDDERISKHRWTVDEEDEMIVLHENEW